MRQLVKRLFSDLREIHQSIGLVQPKFEKRGCRIIAQRFFDRGTPAFSSVGYPENARNRAQKADECDLVIAVNSRDWLWIEKKVIWKPGAGHYISVEAVADARKLAGLRPPQAAYIGLLMLGLDSTKRESANLCKDVDIAYVRNARIKDWNRTYERLDAAKACRLHAWFWWRPVR
jgi:hypothetical protein